MGRVTQVYSYMLVCHIDWDIIITDITPSSSIDYEFRYIGFLTKVVGFYPHDCHSHDFVMDATCTVSEHK